MEKLTNAMEIEARYSTGDRSASETQKILNLTLLMNSVHDASLTVNDLRDSAELKLAEGLADFVRTYGVQSGVKLGRSFKANFNIIQEALKLRWKPGHLFDEKDESSNQMLG